MKLKFPSDETKLVFYAYYPYDEDTSDPTAIAFAVKADQNGKTGGRSNYGASDLLAAKSDNSGDGYGAGQTVQLEFDHALSMLQLTVDNSSGMLDTEPGAITAKLVGVKTAATLDLATPEATVSGTVGNVTMYRVEQPGDTNYATSITFRTLVPAGQTLAAGAQLFEITDGTVILQSPALTSAIELMPRQAELFTVGIPLPDEDVTVSIGGSSSTISANVIGEGLYEITPGGNGSKLVESVTIGGNEYLIGRKDNETITLKIDPDTGDLQLRDAVPDANDGDAMKIPIGSYAEFALIGTTKDGLKGKYLQEADLDLMNEAWTPIGTSTTWFIGTFDGGGHTIANLNIDLPDTDYVGLFGSTDSRAKLSRIGIVSGSVSGYGRVGGVCGYNSWGINNNMTACYNSGSVSGNNVVAGVCGEMLCNITACYNSGPVSGNSYVVGVCASVFGGSITACYYMDYPDDDVTVGIGDGTGEATAFSAVAWPTTTTNAAWGTTTDGTGGGYWKELSPDPLGGWNSGDPDGIGSTFPRLLWEE